MSTCHRSLDALLTAELDELEGLARTALSRHVRDCPSCSTAARTILSANRALEDLLSEDQAISPRASRASHTPRAPHTLHTLVIARARSAPAIRRTVPSRAWTGWSPRAVNRVRLGVAAIAGVGAIGLAFILATVGREAPLPGVEWVPWADPPLAVSAPGRNVAVIPTTNPDITIYLVFEENHDATPLAAPYDGPIAIGPGGGL